MHAVFALCQGQDGMHYFALSAGDPACFQEDPPAKIPSLTEGKTKPVSSSQQEVGVSRTIEKTCRFSSHHHYSSTFSVHPHLPLTVTSSSSSSSYLQKLVHIFILPAPVHPRRHVPFFLSSAGTHPHIPLTPSMNAPLDRYRGGNSRLFQCSRQ